MVKLNDKHIEFIKSLYLEIDTEGNRVNSLQDIATRLLQKHKITIQRSTVGKLAKKEQWDKLLNASKIEGIAKAVADKEDKETAIKDEIAKKVAMYRQMSEQTFTTAKYLLNRPLLILAEDFRANEMEIDQRLSAGEIDSKKARFLKKTLIKRMGKLANMFGLSGMADTSIRAIMSLDSAYNQSEKEKTGIDILLEKLNNG